MEIREATAGDVSVLVGLRSAFIEELSYLGPPSSCAKSPNPLSSQLADRFRAWLPARIASGRFVGLIGFEGADPVSTAFLVVSDRPPTPTIPNGRLATLVNVYTCPGHRRRGFGRQMVEAALAKARNLGLDAVELEATPDGRQVYERLGFNPRPHP